MMGEPLELADKLATANRPRMRLRAWIRHTLRWALIPLAVLIAVACAWQPVHNAFWIYVLHHSEDPSWRAQYEKKFRPKLPPTVTAEQRLIFQGLNERHCFYSSLELNQLHPIPVGPKALWEKWPENQTYLHNYLATWITWDIEMATGDRYEGLGFFTTSALKETRITAERLADAETLVAKLRRYDPDNARFDYLLAGFMVRLACEERRVWDNAKNPQYWSWVVKIHNRALVERALVHWQAALEKTKYQTHYGELERECLGMLEPSTSISASDQQLILLWSSPKIDIQMMNNLLRLAPLYGELLAKEGRQKDADLVLNSWKRMALHFWSSDLVQAPYIIESPFAEGLADLDYVETYRRLGEPEKAVRMEQEMKRCLIPIQQWFHNFYGNGLKLLNARYGQLGYPLLGTDVSEEQLSWSRDEFYTLADTLVLGLISCLALLAMLGCLVATLWFRFWKKSPPMLLLPEMKELVLVAIIGGVLPLLVYQAVSWLPYSGREYTLAYAWPKYAALQVFLVVSIAWLTLKQARHFLRRRCRQLGVAVPPKSHRGWLATAGVLLLAQIIFCLIPDTQILDAGTPSLWPLLPAGGLLILIAFKQLSIFPPPWKYWGWSVPLAAVMGGFVYLACFSQMGWTIETIQTLAILVGFLGFLCLFFAWRHWRNPPADMPFYRGTLVRSLIPVLATLMFFLNLVSTPWHHFQERQAMEAKSEFMVSPAKGHPDLMLSGVNQVINDTIIELKKLEK
jgi:hypothetical protein